MVGFRKGPVLISSTTVNISKIESNETLAIRICAQYAGVRVSGHILKNLNFSLQTSDLVLIISLE